MGKIIEKEIEGIAAAILEDYRIERAVDRIDMFKQPDKQEIVKIISGLLQIVYPGYYFDKTYKIYGIGHKMSVKVEDVIYHLNKQIGLALQFAAGRDKTGEAARVDAGAESGDNAEDESQKIAVAFFKRIPAVRAVLPLAGVRHIYWPARLPWEVRRLCSGLWLERRWEAYFYRICLRKLPQPGQWQKWKREFRNP